MAALAKLGCFGQLSRKPLEISFKRISLQLINKPTNNSACVRFMGGQRKITITHSNYGWTVFKDHLHFYFALGLIPIGMTIAASNLFIGTSELAEIPEDHEPKYWEYYKHPISRAFARYLFDPPEKNYELHLHVVDLAQKKADLDKLEKKVKRLMGERGDYKGWYYLPYHDMAAATGAEMTEDRTSMGRKG